VAGLAAVTGILAFLVLRPSWSRGALSASSSRPRLKSPRNQRTPLRFRGCEEGAITDARVEVAPPHRRQLSTKLRLFLDMLVDRFAEEPRWLEATPDR
jgi:hypothetical protein